MDPGVASGSDRDEPITGPAPGPVASSSRIQIITAPQPTRAPQARSESMPSDTSAVAAVVAIPTPIRSATGSPGAPMPLRVESPRPLSSSRSDGGLLLPDEEHEQHHGLLHGQPVRTPRDSGGQVIEIVQPRPALLSAATHDTVMGTNGGNGNGMPPLPRTASTFHGHRENSQAHRTRSELDWIIPVEAKREPERPRTVRERLLPTLEVALKERDNYQLKAKMTGYALNAAIGMQVVLGSLTTGLSAATTGHSTSIAVSVLGALSTITASYLARARGSNEPELSITRTKDLDQFIRECETFVMDFGHVSGNDHDHRLNELRKRFEELLGNANGERKLSNTGL